MNVSSLAKLTNACILRSTPLYLFVRFLFLKCLRNIFTVKKLPIKIFQGYHRVYLFVETKAKLRHANLRIAVGLEKIN